MESPPNLPDGGPTQLPSVQARAVAFVAILAAGLCGGLIGRALVHMQCSGGCATPEAIGALVGALSAAGGVAIVAVLVLRAMGEWNAGPAGRRG
ncbi:MAG: hypothetical protein LC685_04720 [Actinobacteria bacterium]|nr:hypothetical protein [Actinomycetota bacterium]